MACHVPPHTSQVLWNGYVYFGRFLGEDESSFGARVDASVVWRDDVVDAVPVDAAGDPAVGERDPALDRLPLVGFISHIVAQCELCLCNCSGIDPP